MVSVYCHPPKRNKKGAGLPYLQAPPQNDTRRDAAGRGGSVLPPRPTAMFNYSSLAAWYAVRMALAMSAVRSPEQSPTQVTGTVTPSRSNALALEPTAITT